VPLLSAGSLLLDKVDQLLLDPALCFHAEVAVDLRSRGDVLVLQQRLQFFQLESRLLAPRTHRVPEAVPADIWQAERQGNRFDMRFEQLRRPERPTCGSIIRCCAPAAVDSTHRADQPITRAFFIRPPHFCLCLANSICAIRLTRYVGRHV
jgi:hypothetical protein